MAFTVVQKLDKDPKDITPDYTLDTLGEPCPYPAIVMLETMPQLQKGEILELLSDCAQSINNIPVDTKNHGFQIIYVKMPIFTHWPKAIPRAISQIAINPIQNTATSRLKIKKPLNSISRR